MFQTSKALIGGQKLALGHHRDGNSVSQLHCYVFMNSIPGGFDLFFGIVVEMKGGLAVHFRSKRDGPARFRSDGSCYRRRDAGCIRASIIAIVDNSKFFGERERGHVEDHFCLVENWFLVSGLLLVGFMES